MRKLCYIGLAFVAMSARSAEELACESPTHERFTEQEIEAIRNGDSSYNPLVRETLSHKQRLNDEIDQKLRADFKRAAKIDWEQAKRLILNGLVVMTVQSHNRNVFLVARSGAVYQTTETYLDEVDKVARRVDPCGIAIQLFTE